MSDQRVMNVQSNKSDSQSPAVKGASSPINVDERSRRVMEMENELEAARGENHNSNVQTDRHFSSAVSKAAAQGSSFEPCDPTVTEIGIKGGELSPSGEEEVSQFSDLDEKLVIGDSRKFKRGDEEGSEEDRERFDLVEVNYQLQEAEEGRCMEEEAGEMKKTNKKGENINMDVVVSPEAEMKEMLKALMEMSQSAALKQEEANNRLVEDALEFRMESNRRMERMEENMEFLRKRMEELEAGREQDRVKLKKQVVERRRSAQKVVTSEMEELREEERQVETGFQKVSGAPEQIDECAGVATVSQRPKSLDAPKGRNSDERKGAGGSQEGVGKILATPEDHRKAAREQMCIEACFGGDQVGVRACVNIGKGRMLGRAFLYPWCADSSLLEYSVMSTTGVVMDGQKAPGWVKFVNQSCNPNGRIQSWVDEKGREVMAFEAIKDVKEGEWLSVDYEWEVTPGKPRTPCMCALPDCRQWLERERGTAVLRPGSPPVEPLEVDAEAWTQVGKSARGLRKSKVNSEKRGPSSDSDRSSSSSKLVDRRAMPGLVVPKEGGSEAGRSAGGKSVKKKPSGGEGVVGAGDGVGVTRSGRGQVEKERELPSTQESQVEGSYKNAVTGGGQRRKELVREGMEQQEYREAAGVGAGAGGGGGGDSDSSSSTCSSCGCSRSGGVSDRSSYGSDSSSSGGDNESSRGGGVSRVSVKRRSEEEKKRKRKKEMRKKERRERKRRSSGGGSRRGARELHLQEVQAWWGPDEMAAQDWLERFELHAMVYGFSGENRIHAMGMKLEEEQARYWHDRELTRLEDLQVRGEEDRWRLYRKSFVREFVNREDVRQRVWARWSRLRREDGESLDGYVGRFMKAAGDLEKQCGGRDPMAEWSAMKVGHFVKGLGEEEQVQLAYTGASSLREVVTRLRKVELVRNAGRSERERVPLRPSPRVHKVATVAARAGGSDVGCAEREGEVGGEVGAGVEGLMRELCSQVSQLITTVSSEFAVMRRVSGGYGGAPGSPGQGSHGRDDGGGRSWGTPPGSPGRRGYGGGGGGGWGQPPGSPDRNGFGPSSRWGGRGDGGSWQQQGEGSYQGGGGVGRGDGCKQCYNCGNPAHLSPNCPLRPGEMITPECTLCAEMGHWWVTCPYEPDSLRCTSCQVTGHVTRACNGGGQRRQAGGVNQGAQGRGGGGSSSGWGNKSAGGGVGTGGQTSSAQQSARGH